MTEGLPPPDLPTIPPDLPRFGSLSAMALPALPPLFRSGPLAKGVLAAPITFVAGSSGSGTQSTVLSANLVDIRHLSTVGVGVVVQPLQSNVHASAPLGAHNMPNQSSSFSDTMVQTVNGSSSSVSTDTAQVKSVPIAVSRNGPKAAPTEFNWAKNPNSANKFPVSNALVSTSSEG
ncbi:hypothetical protein YC2023_077265 [Brassica napus]